jgi:hypothetical protein
MKVTLLDDQDLVLTEITSYVGRSPGQMLVDWATRPDALFQYYFDRGGRTVTLVSKGERYSAVLGTRWQMGARFWFLHTFNPVRVAPRGPCARPDSDSGLAAAKIAILYAEHANAAHRAPAAARSSKPRGVPA